MPRISFILTENTRRMTTVNIQCSIQKLFQKQDFEGLSKMKMFFPLFVGLYKYSFVQGT